MPVSRKLVPGLNEAAQSGATSTALGKSSTRAKLPSTSGLETYVSGMSFGFSVSALGSGLRCEALILR